MSWWSIGIAVVSSAANMYNENQLAKKQDQNLAMQIRNQSAQQQKAESKIGDMLKQLQGSNSKDEEKQRMDQYLTTLQQGAQAKGINQGAGGFSDAYRTDAAAAAAGLQDFGAQRAGLLARTDAPGLQRTGEGILFDNTATDIRGIERDANQQAFLDNMALQNMRKNPWITAATELGMAYAGAKAGGGKKSGDIGAVEPEKIDLVF